VLAVVTHHPLVHFTVWVEDEEEDEEEEEVRR